MPSFLDLSPEIRNLIYEYALTGSRPFTAKLHFSPSFTGLLRVNKQTYAEATGYFYAENVFSFPQSLFDDSSILEKLQLSLQFPKWRLATIKKFQLYIPVYRRNSGDIDLYQKVMLNICEISGFLDHIRTSDLEVEVKLVVPAFRYDHQIGPKDFDFIIRCWFWVRAAILVSGGKFKLVIRAWPGCLGECLMLLNHYFGDDWALESDLDQRPWPELRVPRWRYLDIFRDGLKVSGLYSVYQETYDGFIYILSPKPRVEAPRPS